MLTSSTLSFLYFAKVLLYFTTQDRSIQISYVFGNFAKEVGIEYVLNSFNLSLMVGLSVLFVIFSVFFIDFVLKYEKDFKFNIIFCVIQVLYAACLATLMTNDLFNFYIFFELIAICSYILSSLGGRGASLVTLNYLILGIIASGFIVLGIGVLYFSSGFLNISLVIEVMKSDVLKGNLSLAVILILLGFLIKLAIFPFSFWPAGVYKHMPPAVIPIYSSAVGLVTLYGFFLFFVNFFTISASYNVIKYIIFILIIVGVLSFSILSILESDIKKIFAYSTIAQISYSLLSIFSNTPDSIFAGFSHAFSNSISKLALFIILYEIIKRADTSNIKNLFSYFCLPTPIIFTFIFLLIGIIGLPPTFGFFTKLSLIFSAIKDANYYFIALILVGSLLNVFYFWNIVSAMIFKKQKTSQEVVKIEIGVLVAILLAVITLATLTIYFGKIANFEVASISKLYFKL